MRLLFTVGLGLALLGASCTPATPAPAGKAPPEYTFALLSLEGLQALDAQGRVVGRIVELPADSAGVSNLHLSPDRRLLFTIARTSAKNAFGSDIYAVLLDGSGLRPLLEHEAENVFYASPALDRSGQILYAHRRQPVMVDGKWQGLTDEIVRVDLRTGARSVLVGDAADLALSPDGTYLAYMHLKDGGADALWRVNVDGTDARPLLKIRDTWWYQQTPRFSPDGRSIVVSAAGRTVTASFGGKLAHLTIPSDLVLIEASGVSAREISKTNDDTVPAWSPDGREIAYVVGGALNVIDVATGNVRELVRSEGFLFGELAWVRK